MPLLLAESGMCTANVYHDTAPIHIAILLLKHEGQGLPEHPQLFLLCLSLSLFYLSPLSLSLSLSHWREPVSRTQKVYARPFFYG